MASVTFDKATRRFPSMDRPALDSLDLEIVLGVRPEQFEFLCPQDRDTPGLDLVVETVEDTGAVVYLHTTAWSGEGLAHIVVWPPGRPSYGKGASLRVAVRRDGVHCLSAVTGQRFPEDTDTSPVA